MIRYTYAYGYKTREAAEIALDDCMAGDEISECELPKISPYQNKNDERRYRITLADR